MAIQFLLSGFTEQAMAWGVYDRLKVGPFVGTIPPRRICLELASIEDSSTKAI